MFFRIGFDPCLIPDRGLGVADDFFPLELLMKLNVLLALVCTAIALPSLAADVTYRKDIAPLIKAYCADCHAGDAPTLQEFNLDVEKYKKAKVGPRYDTYENLLMVIAYPDPGAFMRRLDDGSNSPDKKPGNMYKTLGENEAERQKNLTTIKAWVGEGGWNLNRWESKGNVPAITKAQLDKLVLKY